MGEDTTRLGSFGAHVYNGGVTGSVTATRVEDWIDYSFKIGVSNFACCSNYEVNLQDEELVEEMIATLQATLEHMRANKDKVAEYV